MLRLYYFDDATVWAQLVRELARAALERDAAAVVGDAELGRWVCAAHTLLDVAGPGVVVGFPEADSLASIIAGQNASD